MSFKDNLRRIRLEKRMTQEVLAEKLDVTFQAVSSWERGEYLPETEKLLKLADVLDVSVSALVNDSASSFSLRDRLFDPEHMKIPTFRQDRKSWMPTTGTSPVIPMLPSLNVWTDAKT